jgi:hypothetical protein
MLQMRDTEGGIYFNFVDILPSRIAAEILLVQSYRSLRYIAKIKAHIAMQTRCYMMSTFARLLGKGPNETEFKFKLKNKRHAIFVFCWEKNTYT